MTIDQKKYPKAEANWPEPYSPEWSKRANEIARSFAPTMKPCRECGQPVPNGYCCNTCGSVDP